MGLKDERCHHQWRHLIAMACPRNKRKEACEPCIRERPILPTLPVDRRLRAATAFERRTLCGHITSQVV